MKEFDRLVHIMAKLRHPQTGCPWDLAQTPETLKEYVVEESYELLETIDEQDPQKMREELGDLLLQIVFLARIAEEQGAFSIREVADTICDKLVLRHPHIFGDKTVKDADEVKSNWEAIKMKEKRKTSILSDYPDAMPALLTAKRLASQASTVGFDWNDAMTAFEKIDEETAELRREIQADDKARAEEEIGDLLFAVANVARLLGVNPEFALQKTNKKFTRRFRYIEAELRAQGRDIRETSLEEMERLWQQAKE